MVDTDTVDILLVMVVMVESMAEDTEEDTQLWLVAVLKNKLLLNQWLLLKAVLSNNKNNMLQLFKLLQFNKLKSQLNKIARIHKKPIHTFSYGPYFHRGHVKSSLV